MRKLLAVVLCVCIAVTLFAGCATTPPPATPQQPAQPGPAATATPAPSGTQPAAPTAPADLERLRVVLGRVAWTNIVEPHLDTIPESYGVLPEYEIYPEDQLSQKLAIEFASRVLDLDVIMNRPLQEANLFVRNGWLYDMTDLVKIPEMNVADFIPAAIGVYEINGRTYGLPLTTERQVLYYRKDMLAAHNLAVPTNLQELWTAAETITDRGNEVYGFVSRGLGAAAVTQFSSYLYNFGGDFMDPTGTIATLDTPEALAAFQYYGDMLRLFGPPGTTGMHWAQAAAVFGQIDIAFYTEADSLFPNIIEQHLHADQLGVAKFPGDVMFNVTSWGFSIGATSQKAESAAKFISWILGDEMIAIAQTAGAPMARISAWDNPELNKNLPEGMMDVIVESNRVGVAHDRPLIIQVGRARDYIGEVLTVAQSGGNIATAAASANAEFQIIIDEDNS